MKTTEYIHLKNFRVLDANAMAGFYSIGLPAMTGPAGFCHVIQRFFKDNMEWFAETGDSVPKIMDFMLIIHDMQLLETHPKYVNYQPDSLRKGVTAATIERPLIHFDFDLIMRIDLDDALDNTIKFYNFIQSTIFKNIILSLPFCSGRLENPKKYSAILFYENEEKFHAALKCISPYSFVIEDATEEMEELMGEFPDNDPLDILLSCISRKKIIYETKKINRTDGTFTIEEDKERPLPKEYKPLYIPLAIGYIGLDEPFNSPFSRFGHQHIMAESLIGLGRAWSMGSYLKNEGLNTWWKYETDRLNNLYLLKGIY